MQGEKHKNARKLLLLILILASLLFWFLTAPASMAVQRIASGTGRGPIALFISNVAECYEAPMALLVRIPSLKRMHDSLADTWCDILGAPETTP